MTKTMIIIAGAVCARSALAHEGDVAIANFNNMLVTGIGSDDPNAPPPDFPWRVYGAELEDQGGFIFTDEPGYLGPFGDGFAQSTALGFNIRAALREWNGSDFFDISDQTMELTKGNEAVTTPGSDQIVPGFTLVSDMSQDFDDHPFYELLDPDTGIYLLELEMTADGFDPSEAIWIVYNFGEDEDIHEASIEWVEANLVPAPSTLMVLSPLILARRRRSVA